MASDFKSAKISLKRNIGPLLALYVKVQRAAPQLLLLETERELLDFLTKGHDSETWVWKDREGNFIGYLTVIDKPKKGELEVLNLGVDPDFEGRGLGKEMMEFAEDLAGKRGRGKVTLVTNKKNQRSKSFYKNLGYVLTGEIANYYGDGETRCLFEKLLK